MTRVTWLGYAVYLLLGWTSALVPALVVDIEGAFDRTDAAIGLLYLVGSALYAAGAIGGGVLAERLDARTMLSAALVLLAAGLLLQGATPVWGLFVLAMAVGRSGGGAADGGVGAIFLQTFPDGRGGALNRLHLFYAVGALLGPAAVGIVLTLDLGWRPLFLGTAAVSLALAAAVGTLPRGVVTERAEQPAEPLSDRERSLVPFVWLAVSIACYEAAALGVVSWLVRYLSDEPVRVATGALSLFWAGICVVRLIGPWLTRRFPPTPLTVGCILGASVALTAGVLVPWTPVAVALFALTGLCFGPVYPMLVAIGGDIYPRRLAALSGGLTAAATLGAIVYPPLMGLVADSVGIKVGLLGAGVLGLPTAAALLAATRSAR